MEYIIEIAVCGLVVLLECIGIFAILAIIQLISYRIFGVNLYKKIKMFFEELEKKF